MVSEPTKSGLSDLERVLGVAKHFGIPAFVCINKYNLNLKVTSEIKQYCRSNGYPVIGKIPFDPSIVKALREFKTPIEAGNKVITNEIKNIWTRLTNEIKSLKGGEIMPRGDGTGPVGYGPMTGRGAGFVQVFRCPDISIQWEEDSEEEAVALVFMAVDEDIDISIMLQACLFGQGRLPFEPAPDYYEEYSPENEVKVLSQEAKFLKQELEAIEDKLDQLRRIEKENPTDE